MCRSFPVCFNYIDITCSNLLLILNSIQWECRRLLFSTTKTSSRNLHFFDKININCNFLFIFFLWYIIMNLTKQHRIEIFWVYCFVTFRNVFEPRASTWFFRWKKHRKRFLVAFRNRFEEIKNIKQVIVILFGIP